MVLDLSLMLDPDEAKLALDASEDFLGRLNLEEGEGFRREVKKVVTLVRIAIVGWVERFGRLI